VGGSTHNPGVIEKPEKVFRLNEEGNEEEEDKSLLLLSHNDGFAGWILPVWSLSESLCASVRGEG
jgi:hypothetical protein